MSDTLHKYSCTKCQKVAIAFETPTSPCSCSNTTWRQIFTSATVQATTGDTIDIVYDSIDTTIDVSNQELDNSVADNELNQLEKARRNS